MSSSSSSSSYMPDCINFKPVVLHNGRYRQRQIPLNNIPVSSATFTASGSTLVEWKIPAQTVFNPSHSNLQYTLTVPAQGAAAYVVNFEDVAEICGSVQVGTASTPGLLVDLQYANNYTAVARKIDTCQQDFLTSDVTSGLYPSSSAASCSSAAGAALNWFPPTATLPAGNPWGPTILALDQVTLQEPQYARIAVLNTARVITRILPLSAFTHTFLAMDRDVMFGEDIYIRVMLSPSYKIAYTSTSVNDASVGAAALANQPVIAGLYLNLAIQEDPLIKASIESKFARGEMKFLIPYQYGWRVSTANAGVVSVQQQLNSGYGRWLKRIIHSPFAGNEPNSSSANAAYDHQNFSSAKISQYQTLINSAPLQDQYAVCASLDDFRLNKEFIKDSAIRGSAAYNHNWFHMDCFSNPQNVPFPEENVIEGLELAMPITWNFNATATAALTHYTFAEFVREIRATPMLTEVVMA